MKPRQANIHKWALPTAAAAPVKHRTSGAGYGASARRCCSAWSDGRSFPRQGGGAASFVSLWSCARNHATISRPDIGETQGASMKAAKVCAVVLSIFAVTQAATAQTTTPQALRIVSTDDAPKAAGPYSQGIVSGGFLFAAGQVPRDPKTGKQVADTFEQAMNRVLDNLEAVLKAEGLDWTDVVKVTVFLTKADDFTPLNTVYAQRMGAAKPARTTVVAAALPGGSIVEMDLIARARK